MNTLVVCYSLSGNSRTVAQSISTGTHAAFAEIRDVRPRNSMVGYLRSVFETLTGRTPAIFEPAHDAAEYDLVILVAPLWAGRLAAPLRTYLTRHGSKLGRYAVAITHGGSSIDKAVAQISDLARRPPAEVLHVRADAVKDGSYQAAVDEFCRSLSALK